MPDAAAARWEPEVIADAIAANLAVAAEAWNRLRQRPGVLLADFRGFELAAQATGLPIETVLMQALEKDGLLAEYARALQAQGVTLTADETDWIDTHLSEEGGARFFNQSQALRCRIRVNDAVVGSGVLMGPNSVLTAWHVIAIAPPANDQAPAPKVEVELSDGRKLPAALPCRSESRCSNDEYRRLLPRSDQDVDQQDDFALLALAEPAGIHLPFACLPAEPYAYPGRAKVLLVHYPEGDDHGIGLGTLKKWRGLSARWKHDVMTAPGSSGGGMFNTRFNLIGIHQGALGNGYGRLVPTIRFAERIAREVARDQAPDSIWSLDDTPGGGLVVGREAFFIAFSAAVREDPPNLKGLWIKRTNPARDITGLTFSYAMLERMVARSPKVRLVRISFDAVIDDLPDEIARRVRALGLEVDNVAPLDGVAASHTEPEAQITDRSRRIANAVDAATAAEGIQLFLFFDHPVVAFGDTLRWALTGFIDQALRLGHLRLVIAGYEAVQLPGLTFANQIEAASASAPGLMMEYLTGFRRLDVEGLIGRAAKALGHEPSPERRKEWADEALAGLDNVSGLHEWWQGKTVDERLSVRLATLSAGGATP